MAALGHIGTMFRSMLIFVLLLSSQISLARDVPTPDDISKWAEKVDTNLRNLNILFVIVKEIYKERAKSPSSSAGISMKYNDVVELDLVNDMAQSLSELLHKQMKALEKSVQAAEDAAAAYQWNGNLMKDDVTYENTKELRQQGEDLQFVDRFGKEVNFNFSSVHIPVEIYDGDIDILNGLNWTAALDEQFKINQKEDPDMLWQYFGSQTGFMRSYPATPWPTNGVDLYDVRRQSWYTQGSSSPKDMMILIDTSGSTHGQSLQLMQNAVKSILDTLGENDYVNIVAFAEQANFVSKCFNHTAFVQANFRNKKQLEKDVDKLVAMGQADFSEAVRFAFEKFKEFAENDTNSENNIGANCNKVIMLLTDGGTDNADDVFDKYNWPNKTVRVFTYAVGPTPNPINALRWMACANRGYFSQIPAMGAIRARVQGYTDHLKEMLEVVGAQDMLWEITYDPRGLGMMTTVTLPVYNRSLGSSNQTILGVMAIDVTTAELEEKTPFHKIGPNGYSFAINPNGYVVFHPNLQTTGKFMTEPPNIDLLELEVDPDNDDLRDLRANMIAGLTGKDLISTLFLSPNRRYVSYGQAKYGYTDIDNTTFRLGLCVPIYQKKYPTFTGDINSFNWDLADHDAFKILIAPWNYHKNMSRQKGLTGTIDDIKNLLKKDPNKKNWNVDLLSHLYWDITHIESNLKVYLEKNVSDVANNNETLIGLFDEEQGKRAVFIMTNGGMMLVSPASEADYFKDDRDPRESSLYKRALHSNRCIFAADFTEGKRSNVSETPYVTTACGVSILGDNSLNQEMVIDKPAVVGERRSHQEVMEEVHRGIQEANTPGLLTCEDEALICYLVDDGGFLVATNREDYREQIGRFLGEVDPAIFNASEEAVFSKTEQYDFQATCIRQKDTVSAGFKDFHIPSFSLLFEVMNLGWWTSKVSWAFTNFNLYSWLFSSNMEVYAEDDEDPEKACVEVTQQYYVKQKMRRYTGSVGCGNCTRSFTAVQLNYTSLLFIVTDPICEECDDKPISQAPRELSETEEENIICEMAQNPRKRIQAYMCYHSDPREDASECGCAALRVSYLSALLVVLSVIWRLMCVTR